MPYLTEYKYNIFCKVSPCLGWEIPSFLHFSLCYRVNYNSKKIVLNYEFFNHHWIFFFSGLPTVFPTLPQLLKENKTFILFLNLFWVVKHVQYWVFYFLITSFSFRENFKYTKDLLPWILKIVINFCKNI